MKKIIIMGAITLLALAAVFIIVITVFRNKGNTPVAGTSGDEKSLTLIDPRKSTNDREVLTSYDFGSNYSLVEIRDKLTSQAGFEFCNLVTGDRDLLPTDFFYTKLSKMQDPKRIILDADGRNYMKKYYRVFPFIIECTRNYENPQSNRDFYPVYKYKYLNIDESLELGSVDEGAKVQDRKLEPGCILMDVRATLDGLQFLFGPIAGKEGDFSAEFTRIPPTKILYDKSKGQFVAEFLYTTLPDNSKPDALKGNNYFNSAKLFKDGNNIKVYIELTDKTKFYTGDISHMVDSNLPCLSLLFAVQVNELIVPVKGQNATGSN